MMQGVLQFMKRDELIRYVSNLREHYAHNNTNVDFPVRVYLEEKCSPESLYIFTCHQYIYYLPSVYLLLAMISIKREKCRQVVVVKL